MNPKSKFRWAKNYLKLPNIKFNVKIFILFFGHAHKYQKVHQITYFCTVWISG